MKKQIVGVKKVKKKMSALKRYKKAYNILMDYYDELDIESRKEIDEELNKLDL